MKRQNTFFSLLYSLLFLISCSLSAQAMAQAQEISSQLIQVSKKRISRTVYEFTFKATLINRDIPIKNVTATITSSSPHTVIMTDNTVSFNDLAANETATSIDTFTLRQDRKFRYNPDAIHWDIQYDPDVPLAFEVDGQITGWASDGDEVEVPVNEGSNFGNYYSFSAKGEPKIPFTLRLNRTVIPAQGLSFTQDINGLEFQTNQYDRLRAETKEAVIGNAPGEYAVTTKATVVETGQTFTVKAKVRVYSEEEPFLKMNLRMPMHSGEKIPVESTINSAAVYASVSGHDADKITSVKIIRLETSQTQLLQPVSNNNLSGRYEGTVLFNTGQPDICYTYAILVETTKGNIQSKDTEKVCITEFPIGLQHPGQGNLWQALLPRFLFANNSLIITVKEGTSEARLREIAGAVNGRIIGQAMYGSEYQIEFLDPPGFLEGLENYAQQLLAFPEVISVNAYGKTNVSMSLTDDPLFLNDFQPYLNQIRADETWLTTDATSADAPNIAIVDTGIDFSHPDLAGKVMQGQDFLNILFDETTRDVHSHGTHVAGIAAAITRNATGISGIANSALLPVRVADAGRDAYYLDIANGIKWASKNGGEIINVSMGVPEDVGIIGLAWCGFKYIGRDGHCDVGEAIGKICNAVDTATNNSSIVIASSGNAGKDVKNYPAACENAIAVGAVDALENRASYSNFGDWIDIAAPGNIILSTTPLGLPLLPKCSVPGGALYYDCKTGTSQAAPQVSGALAQILARHPGWKDDKDFIDKAKKRLLNTAKPIPSADLGQGQLNIFDAVFNGDFELIDDSSIKNNPNRLAEWEHKETSDAFLHCKAVSFFGNITPPKGEKMLSCGTQGVYEFNTSLPSAGTFVKNRINLPEGVTQLPLSFRWKVASVDLSLSRQTVLWDDRITFRLRRVDDPSKEVILFDTSLNHIMNNGRNLSTSFIYPFVETDWTLDSYAHPIPYGAGEYELIIGIADRYDNVGDTYIFVDDLQFRLR